MDQINKICETEIQANMKNCVDSPSTTFNEPLSLSHLQNKARENKNQCWAS